MKKMLIALAGFSLVAACASAGDAPTFGSGQAALASGAPRVIVVAAPGHDLGELRGLVAAEGGTVRNDLALVHGVSAVLPDRAAAHRLSGDAAVLRVDDDAVVTMVGKPNCSPWPDCKNGGGTTTPPPPQVTPWGITRTGADQVWGTTTGSGVKVVVIDTGISPTHPDLHVAGGINFVSKGPRKPADPNKWADDNGHGTHVSGTIAGIDDDAYVVGMAPDVELWACKALDQNGSGYLSDVVACLDWAVANGMRIASMSLGSSSDVQSLHDAVDNAYAAGMLIVAAAGNSGDGNAATNDVGYPAKYSSVMAVAATDDTDGTPYWSSEGSEVEIAGPGVAILSDWNDGGLYTASGTSMATPHVTGAAADFLAAYPGSTNVCVRTRLDGTAEDLGAPGPDVFYGNGLVDVPAALAAGPCP